MVEGPGSMRMTRCAKGAALGAAAALLLAGCTGGAAGRGTSAPVAATTSPHEEYRIGPEDVLEVTVWRNENLSRTVPVRPDGKISLPLVNDVQAAGLTALELRNEIARRLKEFVTAPDVTVTVAAINSLKVNILGQVQKPGVLDLKRRATVLEAIAMAGGLTPFAAANDIVVIRRQADGRTVRIGVRYKDLVRGDDRQNIVLERGDTVMVPQSLF